MKMKQRRVTIKQVAPEAGVSLRTIPSVRAPLGDFFGVGHAVAKHYVSLPLNAIFGPRRGPKGPFAAAMNSYFTMPFGSAAKVFHEATEENPAPWDLPGVNLTGDENYTLPNVGSVPTP